MDTGNLETTTRDEINAEFIRLLDNRQALYDLSSELIMLDYRPEFAKLHRRGSRSLGVGLKGATLLDSLGHLFVYIHMAWETGILNTVHSCRRQGVTRDQLLDVFMAGQVTGGPRGAENIYRAVWMMLRDYRDRPEPAEFPDGWAPDNAAFRCGLDLSTPDLTDADVRAITDWYERTIGYVPSSVTFAAEHHPRFLLDPADVDGLLDARPVQSTDMHGHSAAPHPVVLAVGVQNVVRRQVAAAHLESEAKCSQRAGEGHVHMVVARA